MSVDVVEKVVVVPVVSISNVLPEVVSVVDVALVVVSGLIIVVIVL